MYEHFPGCISCDEQQSEDVLDGFSDLFYLPKCGVSRQLEQESENMTNDQLQPTFQWLLPRPPQISKGPNA